MESAGVIEQGSEAPQASITDHQKDIRRSIALGARLSVPFLVMNALATIIAGYGLLMDSTAVVIGAMIIAMLMGPIMGLALAMVDGDSGLFQKAIVAEVLGAGMVVLIGVAIGRFHFDLPITSEILARTQPNLLDLVVALAGGAAGAYATVSPRVGVGLVGVAISTALVPPLTTVGICLSRGQGMMASGAFILFLTNLVAIQCAASVVLYLHGFHEVTAKKPNDRAFVRRLIIDGALFLTLAVFLTFQLNNTIGRQRFERDVKVVLLREINRIPGATLAELTIVERVQDPIVVATVRVPNSITPKQTSEIEKILRSELKSKIELHVRSTLTKETVSTGYLHEIAPRAVPPDDPNARGSLVEESRPVPEGALGQSESSTQPVPVNL